MRRKAPGTLPSDKWLSSHGFHYIARAKQKHPEAFTHILQRKLRPKRTTKEWVSFAEDIAGHNNGKLPLQLGKRHPGLYQAMLREPKAFRHIPRERVRKEHRIHTVTHYIALAKELEQQYGEVPYCSKLYRLGHGALYQSMQDNPRAFRGIKRAKKQRGPDRSKCPKDRAKEAKELAEQNGGFLPSRAWLFQNGHGAIWHAMKRHPHLFSDVPQAKPIHPRRCVCKWVPIAETVAEQNGGKLPGYSYLCAHGMKQMTAVMSECPEPFAHIPRARTL